MSKRTNLFNVVLYVDVGILLEQGLSGNDILTAYDLGLYIRPDWASEDL